jgi:lipopolysaccharide/colanic/teichoic acid biosynthesis glycosyltransferase
MAANQGLFPHPSSTSAGEKKRTDLLFEASGLRFVCSDFGSICTFPTAENHLAAPRESLVHDAGFWTLLAVTTVFLAASHGAYRRRGLAAAGIINFWFLTTLIFMVTLASLIGHPDGQHPIISKPVWTSISIALTTIWLCGSRAAFQPGLIAYAARACPPSRTIAVCFDQLPDRFDVFLETALRRKTTLVIHHAVQQPCPSAQPDLKPPCFAETLRQQKFTDVVFVLDSVGFPSSWLSAEGALPELLAYPTRVWLAVELGQDLRPALVPSFAGLRIVNFFSDELVHSSNETKRIFDISLAIILIVLSVPILAACAAMVWASGPGPIIYRQQRIGAQGKIFTILKFRSMFHRPELRFAPAAPHDPRVTGFGRFLRRTALDELPQLFNVLHGEMSLVGPRPHAVETLVHGTALENASHMYRARYRVKPGMTGLAQVRGQRGEIGAIEKLEQRLASDLEYIRRWSPWLDIEILLQTIPALFNFNTKKDGALNAK